MWLIMERSAHIIEAEDPADPPEDRGPAGQHAAVLRGPVARADVRRLAAWIEKEAPDLPERFPRILERFGPDGAAIVLLAAIVAGRPQDASLLLHVLPSMEDVDNLFPVLIWRAAGDRLGMIMDLAERDTMHYERTALAFFVATEILAEDQEAGTDPNRALYPPRRLLALMRTFARKMSPDRLMGFATLRIEDEGLQRVAAPHQERTDRPAAQAELQRLRRLLRTAPLHIIPERAEHRIAGFTVRRTVERVGRNDTCPCQSGKKYKRCCAEKDAARAADPSPVPGLTLPEYRARIAEFVPLPAFRKLSVTELSQLPLQHLPFEYLAAVLEKLTNFHRWEQVDRVLALMESFDGKEDEVDEHRMRVVRMALYGRAPATLQRHVPRLKDPSRLGTATQFALKLLLPTGETLSALEECLAEALQSKGEPVLSTVASAVMDYYPALGLVLARGSFSGCSPGMAQLLLDQIEEARDRLDLPPADPYLDVFARLNGLKRAEARRVDELQRLRNERGRLTKQLHELHIKLDEARAQLARLSQQRPPEEASGPGPEEAPWAEERRRLQRKVLRLKWLLSERNRERAALRRQLDEQAAQAAQGPDEGAATGIGRAVAPKKDGEDGEDGEGEERGEGVEGGVRRPVLPVFSRAVAEALREVPARVAREALIRSAELAGGDAAAWRGAKRLLSTTPPLWSARVGIHYRLIFHPEEGTLEILELIHRRLLEAKIKRLYL
jgi:hypothetical protein